MLNTIKELPVHSRPREKLRENGPASLTDDELVAAILCMGTAGIDVRTMARQVAGLNTKAPTHRGSANLLSGVVKPGA